MKKYSLTKAVLGAHFIQNGVISHPDGSLSKAYELEPLSSGVLEESFDGQTSDAFFAKLSDLLSKLPNLIEGQLLVSRKKVPEGTTGFVTKVYAFEKVQKPESYSHLQALLNELKLSPEPLGQSGWLELLSGYFGEGVLASKLPDMTWDKECVCIGDRVVRALSITELPQITWKGCLQPVFENPNEFILSVRFSIPNRAKIKRQLETKRRVSHALSITTSLEVRNIESNSVLSSSEETLERILVGKETLFELSVGVLLSGTREQTLSTARDMERAVSGIGNAGLFMEGIGTLPIFQSHIPGNKVLGIRKLPVLSKT